MEENVTAKSKAKPKPNPANIDLSKPINSAELLAKIRGEKYTPPKRLTMEERLAKLAADIDERLVRIEDAMEEMNEWKHEHGKQLQELNLRLHDIERLIEEE